MLIKTQGHYTYDLQQGVDLVRDKNKPLYGEHKRGAKRRNIDWQFTFETWVEWWENTGHFHERGRKKGQYVMARIGDIGPYSPSNVFCSTVEDNIKNIGVESKKRKIEGGKATQFKPGHTVGKRWKPEYQYICPKGSFSSIGEIENLYPTISIRTLYYWFETNKNGFSRIKTKT